MKLQLGILLYLPPPRVGCVSAFVEHIQAYKRATDLLVYSEHAWPIPGIIMLKGNPEQFRYVKDSRGVPSNFACANVVFFAGLKIAKLHGYSHIMVIEPDVRVGKDHWDRDIWDEYFDLGFPCVAAGTLVTHNPCNHSPLATARWAELVKRNQRKNFPIATYGWVGSAMRADSMVFPNGALSVYDMTWMERFFGDLTNINYGDVAAQTAWDFYVGQKIWSVFKEDSYLVTGHLTRTFSGYADIITTEEMRRNLLLSGEVVAVHQIKSNWVPPV